MLQDSEGAAAGLAGQPWYALAGAQALAALGSSEQGLSGQEAAARLARFGPNVLPRAERTAVLALYLRQFKNPLVYLLLAATVVSLGVGDLADAFFIFVVLQLNAAIGAMYLPGLSGFLDMRPVAFTDWAMVAAVAMSLIVVIEWYKKAVAPRLRHPDESVVA